MTDENLPVPFDEAVHRPVRLGYHRAEALDVTADLVGDFAKQLVADGIRLFFR